MITIYKYALDNTVYLPRGAVVLSVGLQNDQMYLWAHVDSDQQPVQRNFIIVGTGWDLSKDVRLTNARFIGTVHQSPFVWHVFEDVR